MLVVERRNRIAVLDAAKINIIKMLQQALDALQLRRLAAPRVTNQEQVNLAVVAMGNFELLGKLGAHFAAAGSVGVDIQLPRFGRERLWTGVPLDFREGLRAGLLHESEVP